MKSCAASLFYVLLTAWIVSCTNHTSDIVPVLEGGAKVSVTRGKWEQPRIVVQSAGEENPDVLLFRTQGFVQAKDRFFQIDLLRRASRGQLSELFGEKAYEKDVDVIAVGLAQASENSIEKLKAEPEIIRALQAYAAGINQYIDSMGKLDPTLLAFYRRLTGDPNYVPRRWEIVDSVSVGQAAAFYLSSSIKEKLVLGMAAMSLGGANPLKTFVDLIDLRAVEKNTILPRTAKGEKASVSVTSNLFGRSKNVLSFSDGCQAAPLFSFPIPDGCRGEIPGSNNWVVGPKFAGGQKALLANDPHLVLTYPISFYEMALDSKKAGGTFRVSGMNIPGMPGIMIGHNEKIAWGFTNAMADLDEIYSETLDFDSQTKALWGKTAKKKDNWVSIQEKSHSILVRKLGEGVEDRPIKLRYVPHHGPIFSDHLHIYDEEKGRSVTLQEKLGLPNTVAFSYRWVGHEGSTEMKAVMGLNRASNFQQFKQSLQAFEAGPQNIVYADTEGNIGYYCHGRFPNRPFASKDNPPFMPVRGFKKLEWEGVRAEVPQLYNPAKGYIVTANTDPYGKNQKPHLSNFSEYYGYHFALGSRAKRIEDLLLSRKQSKGKLTATDMREIQFDHKDLFAERMVAELKRVLPKLKPEVKNLNVVKKLTEWDFQATREKTEPIIFYLWLIEVMKQYASDIIEEYSEQGLPSEKKREVFNLFLIGSRSVAASTAYHKLKEAITHREKRAIEAIEKSLRSTSKRMEARRVKNVRWGEVHRLVFANPLEDFLPKPGWPQLERDGTWTTVDMAGFDLGPLVEPKRADLHLPHFAGPVFRLVMEITKGGGISGYSVLPGGVSGDYHNAKSQEELRMWRDGKQRRLISWEG